MVAQKGYCAGDRTKGLWRSQQRPYERKQRAESFNYKEQIVELELSWSSRKRNGEIREPRLFRRKQNWSWEMSGNSK